MPNFFEKGELHGVYVQRHCTLHATLIGQWQVFPQFGSVWQFKILFKTSTLVDFSFATMINFFAQERRDL